VRRAALTLMLLVSVGCAQARLPTYVCRRAVDRIVIDGRLVEQSWLKAESTGNFWLCEGERPSLVHTAARMVWDEAALYIAFECADPDIYATYGNKDDPLWVQDVVEVYIEEQSQGQGHFLEYEQPLRRHRRVGEPRR